MFTSLAILDVSAWHYVGIRYFTAAIFMILVFPTHIAATFKDIRSHSDYAVIGLIGLAAPAILEVWRRYSYGPPFSDVIFLLVLTPVFVIVPGLIRASFKSAIKACGIGVGVIGLIVLLASWERPSTFSPLSRYAAIEWPLLAAAFFQSGIIWFGARSLKKRGVIETSMGSLAYAGLFTMVFATFFGIKEFTAAIDQLSLTLASIGTVGTALPLMLMLWLLRDFGRDSAVSAWLLVPPALTFISMFEWVSGFSGSNPLVQGSAQAGIILIFAAFLFIWMVGRMPDPNSLRRVTTTLLRKITTAVLLLVVLSTIIALVGAAAQGYVSGRLSDGAPYQQSWTIGSFETVGGWMLLAIALLSFISGAMLVLNKISLRQIMPLSLLSFLLWWSYTKAGAILIINWFDWMPMEVMTMVGTPDVTLTITPIFKTVSSLVGVFTAMSTVLCLMGGIPEKNLGSAQYIAGNDRGQHGH